MKPTVKYVSKLFGLLVVCSFALLCTSKAKAQVAQDDLCPNNDCGDIFGGVGVVTSENLPTLEFANSGVAESGTAILVILVPNGGTLSAGFTVNSGSPTNNGTFSSGSIFAFLGGMPTANNLGGFPPTVGSFAAFQSSAQQAGAAVTSFTVYTVSLGAFNSTTPIPITLSGMPVPTGTTFWGFLMGSPLGSGTCSSGTTCVSDVVALDEAVTVSATPEPGTLALVGSGLLLFGFGIRRRLLGQDSQ